MPTCTSTCTSKVVLRTVSLAPWRLSPYVHRAAFVIEAQSYNFARAYGHPMALPPSLYEQLRLGGVDMRHIVADPSLEN